MSECYTQHPRLDRRPQAAWLLGRRLQPTNLISITAPAAKREAVEDWGR
jgi:hypothetical protein